MKLPHCLTPQQDRQQPAQLEIPLLGPRKCSMCGGGWWGRPGWTLTILGDGFGASLAQKRLYLCPDHQMNAVQARRVGDGLQELLLVKLQGGALPLHMAIPRTLACPDTRFPDAWRQIWPQIERNHWVEVGKFVLERARPEQLQQLQPVDFTPLLKVGDRA